MTATQLEAATAPDRRAKVLLVARLVASAVMLAILIDRVPRFGALAPRWDNGALWWLAAGLLATLAGIWLSALRWQRVASALGVRARLSTLFNQYLAGQFVSNFLPSTIGGDVLRVRRLSSLTGTSPKVFASVVLERLTGWLVLPLITLTALAVNPGLRHLGTASTVALWISLSTLAGLAAVLTMAAHPRIGGRLAHHQGWTRFLGAVHLGVDQLRRAPRAALGVVAVGFAYQLTVVFAALMAAESLGLEPVGPTAVLAFMPAVAIAQVLPISFGGLGVREGAFVLFLHPLGVATADAITLGLLVYALNLAVSLLGAPAFAAGNRARNAARAVA